MVQLEIDFDEKPALFGESMVHAESLNAFLDRYYRPERLTGRGIDYERAVRKSHCDNLALYGYDIISRHDSVTGKAVAYAGAAL